MTMDDRRFMSIGQVQDQFLNPNTPKVGKDKNSLPTSENSFASVLNKVKESTDNINSEGTVKFSKHAMNRLSLRNIELTTDQMERLSQGRIEAGEKGIRDSLILVDQLAFIVNVPSGTVVTAMDQTENKNNVFTNIDGAVIA